MTHALTIIDPDPRHVALIVAAIARHGEGIRSALHQATGSPFTEISESGELAYWYHTPDKSTHCIAERHIKPVRAA
jgi:hypothetical protein